MAEPFAAVHCPACNKLLFIRRGGGEQRIMCRCKREIAIDERGAASVYRDAALPDGGRAALPRLTPTIHR